MFENFFRAASYLIERYGKAARPYSEKPCILSVFSTNPNKLANTFRSEKKSEISYDTIKSYIDFLYDSFLEENLVCNGMRVRRFNVDVGVVPTFTKSGNGIRQRANLEVDFVCNLGSRKYYIQSAYRIESGKMEQERASLLKVEDSFKKIIILGEECPVTRDEHGITAMSIYDFLLKENSLEL